MASAIATETVVVTTTGGAGAATGSATSKAMRGMLLDIFFAFGAAPSTTDTTVAYDEPDLGTILTLTNVNTNGLYAPLQAMVDGTGVANGIMGRYPLNGSLLVSLAQCDALTPAVTVTIRYMRAD